MFGGFVSVPWSDCSEYIQDDKAFIFSIDHMKKFLPKNPEFALFLGPEYILCFGNDIMISNHCNEEENCTSKFPEDYSCELDLSNVEKQ